MKNKSIGSINGEYRGIRLCRLSDPQVGIWEAEMTYPETVLYNYTVFLTFGEEINSSVLNKALNLFIEKNDGLRMRIIEQRGIPMQYAAPYEYKETDIFDFSGRDAGYTREWMAMKAQIPFNLQESELYYFAIIENSNHNTILFVKVHHIVMDAWSLYNLMLNRLMYYYSSLANNLDIPGTAPSYEEYIAENCEYNAKPENVALFHQCREFWKGEYQTLPGCIALKPGRTSLEANRKVYRLPEGLSEKLRLLSRRTGYSPYIIFLSALSVYIYRMTSERDMVVGGITLNRLTQKEKETFGMFANTVPIRLKLDPDKDFFSYLGDVKKKWKQIAVNQKYTINHITEDFRKLNQTTEKLFDVVISYQNVKLDTGIIKYEVDMAGNGHQTETLRIHISDREDSGSYRIEVEYLTDKFTGDEVDTLFIRLSTILKNAVEDPGVKLSCLQIISEEERRRILEEYNRTRRDYPKDKTLHRLFEEQVKKKPESIALIFKGIEVTYGELNQKANSLASVLKEKGVGPGCIVALLAERSIEMITAVLAVLKAGGTYLPLDPTFPRERLMLMLEDSRAVFLLIYGPQSRSVFSDGDICTIEVMDLSEEELYRRKSSNPENIYRPELAAYIIYTSGSTGRPKGVVVGHRSVTRIVKNTNYIDITSEDRLLQLSNYAFDGSVFDIYGALLNGAALIIPEKEDTADAVRLTGFIRQKGITVFFVTAALFNVIVDTDVECLQGARKVLFGGERASAEHVIKAFRHLGPGKIVNVYGPTESTVFAAYYPVDSVEMGTGSIPIGKPLANTYVYILDKQGNVLPEGVTGELYISGDGLAMGYLNRPELTCEKFISNPFLEQQSPGRRQETRMYRTGDLARWLPDGNIEFVGRADKQIKLRGYRIELGEIEACLKAYGSVRKAVVILNESKSGTKLLCAYLTADEKIPACELKEYAGKKLPYYMVPACFIFINTIPLTPNGKVDIKALPAPESSVNETNYAGPQNRLQEIIADAWKKVLEADKPGEDKIGINDDFFHIGGHSLLAMRLALELEQMDISIKVTDIYKNKTIAQQADFILSKNGGIFLSECRRDYPAEAAVQSFNIGEIKANRFKLIKSVVENNDSYTWQELNCFYRPAAILYESYAQGYFDIFLFMVSYYSTHMAGGWFTNVFESGIFHEFFKFHQNVMKPKTGLSFETESFRDETEMHCKLKDALNGDSPVLVPIDLYGLYYTQGYRRSSHRHYLIVKGYDEEREIYHILDNMQIDNGAYTVYKDFSIRSGELYKMNCLYFENCCPESEPGQMWVLRKDHEFQKEAYSVNELLRDHRIHLNAVGCNKAEVHFLEYELYRRRDKINMDEVNSSFTVLNFKPVYYDLLYRMIKKCGGGETEIAYLKDFAEKEACLCNDIKLAILDAAAGNKTDEKELQLKFDRKLRLEKEFRNKLENTMGRLDISIHTERSDEQDIFGLFKEKNYRKAEIIRGSEKIIFKLDSGTAYDTWDIHDNAPQLLTYPGVNEKFILETRVKLDNIAIGPYQAGLIVFLKTGVKILFGMDKGHRMSVFCPEKGDEYTLFKENFSKNTIYLRIKKNASILSFYSKNDGSEEWVKKYEVTECGDVSSCGIFAKTFEKTSLTSEFSELRYTKL